MGEGGISFSARPGSAKAGRRRALLVAAFVIAALITLGYVVLIWQEAVPAATTLPRANGSH